MFSIFVSGGPLMIALLLCSFVGVYVSVQKFLYLKSNEIKDPLFVDMIKRSIRSVGLEGTLSKLKEMSPVMGLVTDSVTRHAVLSDETAQSHIENDMKKVVQKLESNMDLLSTIVTATPILGLLGTVVGLIDIFNVISGGGIGDPEALSAGIATALITTVTGLSIAIPFLFIHHFLGRKIDRLILDMEIAASELLVFCRSNVR